MRANYCFNIKSTLNVSTSICDYAYKFKLQYEVSRVIEAIRGFRNMRRLINWNYLLVVFVAARCMAVCRHGEARGEAGWWAGGGGVSAGGSSEGYWSERTAAPPATATRKILFPHNKTARTIASADTATSWLRLLTKQSSLSTPANYPAFLPFNYPQLNRNSNRFLNR